MAKRHRRYPRVYVLDSWLASDDQVITLEMRIHGKVWTWHMGRMSEPDAPPEVLTIMEERIRSMEAEALVEWQW